MKRVVNQHGQARQIKTSKVSISKPSTSTPVNSGESPIDVMTRLKKMVIMSKQC